MPAPNDLTPEEEAAFADHGVPSAGPGREPLSEAPIEQQQQGQGQPEPTKVKDSKGSKPSHVTKVGGLLLLSRAKVNSQPPTKANKVSKASSEAAEPGQEEGGEPRMVPLAALHEARQVPTRLPSVRGLLKRD
jgi:hypothetical protein